MTIERRYTKVGQTAPEALVEWERSHDRGIPPHFIEPTRPFAMGPDDTRPSWSVIGLDGVEVWCDSRAKADEVLAVDYKWWKALGGS